MPDSGRSSHLTVQGGIFLKKQILAVCDTEAEYTRRFCHYVESRGPYPFEIAAFTSKEKLKEFCGKQEVPVLLISESDYDLSLEPLVSGQIVVLSENRPDKDTEQEQIYKYQPCENIIREVMSYYVRQNADAPALLRTSSMKLIGLYSPVHRCFQTTFALTMGQILARKYKVLYLNFESYSGLQNRLNREFMTDMSDLIYYVTNARETLYYKLKEMTETIQGLDYIPPAFSYMDLNRITSEQWFAMFAELEKYTSYDYLILDLSDNMQGLFDILRMCYKVFTLMPEDGMALAKQEQYETLLERTRYSDILEKTCRLKMPHVRNIPLNLEQLTYSELAGYIRKIVREELYEQ